MFSAAMTIADPASASWGANVVDNTPGTTWDIKDKAGTSPLPMANLT